MTRRPDTKDHRTRGLTLIELVVAMAVFALIAVMGLQSLSGSLRMRDALVTRADDTAHLSYAAAMLRNDLAAAAPMAFYPPKTPQPLSSLRADPDGRGFALSLLGQSGLRDPSGRVDAAPWQRVEWRLEEGKLIRHIWPTLYPVTATQRSPAIPVMDGVNTMTLRSYWQGKGWVAGLVQRGAGEAPPEQDGDQLIASEGYSNMLPLAMEVTLETVDHGRLTFVEYFQ